MDRPPRKGRALQAEVARPLARAGSRIECRHLQHVRGRLRRGVGQHREHERLGVPERVAVVAGSGQALGRYRRAAPPVAAACSTWNIANRSPAGPRRRRRARRRRVPRSPPGTCRWARARPSQPCSSAVASAPSTCERRAGAERRLDHAVGDELDEASGAGRGLTLAVTVNRACVIGTALDVLVRVPRGPRTMWSIAAAMRRLACAWWSG